VPQRPHSCTEAVEEQSDVWTISSWLELLTSSFTNARKGSARHAAMKRTKYTTGWRTNAIGQYMSFRMATTVTKR
jgi:hypothetical protein